MGIERIVLEYHGDIPILGSYIVHQFAIDIEFTFGDLLEPRNHSQGRGFSAAGRANEHDELLVFDVKVEFLNSNNTLIGYLKI